MSRCSLAWFLVDSLRAYPHYLAYFNELVDRRQAYRHLIDSNLDWGQDLPGLKRWLDEHQPRNQSPLPVYYAFYGKMRPDFYGIQGVPLREGEHLPAELHAPTGGLFCVSSNALWMNYDRLAGPWNKRFEARYRAAQSKLRTFSLVDDPETGATGRPNPMLISQMSTVRTYLGLRCARLMCYLRHREPDDEIGYSILIYRLTDAEVQQALEGPPLELAKEPWLDRAEADLQK